MRAYWEKAKHHLSGNAHSVKGYINLSILRVAQLALSLLGTHFLAHSLSVAQYGEYQYVLNVIGMLTIFTLTEASNTLIQSIARGYKGSFRKVLPYPFLFSLIGSLILLGFAFWHGWKEQNDSLMWGFIISSIFFPCMYGLTIWKGYRLGEHKFGAYTSVEIASLFVIQVGTIVITFLFKQSYLEVLFWLLFVTSVVNVLMSFRVLKKIGKNEKAEENVVPYTIKSSFYTSFSIASNYLDKLLLVHFLDATALAIYVAAERIPELLKSPVQDVASALLPRLATKDKYTKKLDIFFKSICIAFAIGALVFSFTILPWLISTIYGEKYNEAIVYSQILMAGVVLGNMGSLQIRYVRSKLHTGHLKNIMIVTSLFRASSSLILIPMFGLPGAVASAALYKLILSIVINYVVVKNYKE